MADSSSGANRSGEKAGGAPGTPAGEKRAAAKGQRPQSHLPEIHRQLPQSLDAEKGVLCSVLLAPQQVLDICIERGVSKAHFHFPAHATLYEVLRDLGDGGKPIDLVTVTQELSDRNLLEQTGGASALADLFTFIPTHANADFYLEILREKHLLRQVIMTCTEFASRSYEEQGDVRVLLDEVEKRVFEIGEQRFHGELSSIKNEVMAAISNIEHLYKNRGGITGLPTGFSKLDQMTSGLHGGEMIIIAARPSMGKTAFAMNIAEHVSVDLDKPVAIFSLEMSSQQLVQRLLCSRARINLQRIRDGFLNKADFPKLSKAAADLTKSKVFIDDTAGLSILELRAKARRMRDRLRIELIVVDYLQLLRSTSKRAQENRQIEVAEISYGLKALAKELDIPIVVLAQLNRQPDEKGGRPMLSHLRESGSIEQDADVVGMLFRPEVYEKDEEAREEKAGEAELIIAKQRNGPVGEVPLTFLKEFTRFEDRAAPHGEEPH
jgi:replicative DNA helicase